MEPVHRAGLEVGSTAVLALFVKRDGPPKPWHGFNYTQQDIDLHLAERASVPATFAISTIFPVLAIIAVTLRFIAAGKSKAGRTADDWIIFASLVRTCGCSGRDKRLIVFQFPTIASCVWMIATYIIDEDRIVKSFFKEAEKGNFTELDDPLGNANALQWGPGVVSTFYLTALALIKLSILLLYKRLFDTKTMRRIVWGGVMFVIAIWITFVVPSLLGLANVKGVSNGTIIIFILAFGCVDLITDIFLLALPVPFVWRLQMTMSRKLQIVGMFSLGAFCVVSSTVRLAFLVDYFIKLQFIFSHELNWYASFTIAVFAKSWWMTWIWALIEPCTSIIAACLPTLRPLVDGLGSSMPLMSRILGVVYPSRSINSRSTGKSGSAGYGRTGTRSRNKRPLSGSDMSGSITDSVELAKISAPVRMTGDGGAKFAVEQDVRVKSVPMSPEEKMFGSHVHVDANGRPDWNRSSKNLARGASRSLRPAHIERKHFNSPVGGVRGDIPSPLYPEYGGAEWV